MDTAQLAEEPTARHVGGEATVATAATTHIRRRHTPLKEVALVQEVAQVAQVVARDLAGRAQAHRSCTHLRR